MADAQDLKSWDHKKSCGFKSRHRHHCQGRFPRQYNFGRAWSSPGGNGFARNLPGSWNPATDRCSELLLHNVSPILHDLTPADEFCGRQKANAGTARSRSRHDWRSDRERSDVKRTPKRTADLPGDETKFLARVD